jgi:glycosyl transferase family 25
MTPNLEAANRPADDIAARAERSAKGDGGSLAERRVNEVVDAVLVVGVRSFHDRIAHITGELARFGIAFEWIFDFDPDTIAPGLIEKTFAPSDMRLPHQSAVLKHIATWRICVERNYRRVMVFEDDVVLADNFPRVLALAMAEADALHTPYLVYLGCGHNRYAAGAINSPTMLVPGGPLPAAEAMVLDHASCVMRLAWLDRNRVTRPPDWLLREVDAELRIPHYWLREPVVEQGSMNGKFSSVLDDKRRGRGRLYAWLRFRWDRWRHRTVGGRTVPTDHA